MLKLTDLAVTKELNHKDMAGVTGGHHQLAALFDGSVRMDNKVADVTQGFLFGFDQANAGAVTNNQVISGGNGIVYAPVHQDLNQYNTLFTSGIGNTSVS